MEPSYSQYLLAMTSRIPSLGALSDFLHQQPRTVSNGIVSYTEFEGTGILGPIRKAAPEPSRLM